MAPVRVAESKAALGLPLTVASPNLKGAYGAAGVRARCSDPSKKCSVRAMENREPALALAPELLLYKEGREEGQAKGR